jgi:hypothetical protein
MELFGGGDGSQGWLATDYRYRNARVKSLLVSMKNAKD